MSRYSLHNGPAIVAALSFGVGRMQKEGGMTGGTITRADLSEAVYQEVGLSRNESAELVESVLNEISEALVRGEMVKRSEEHTSELQSLMRISYAVFCLQKKNKT